MRVSLCLAGVAVLLVSGGCGQVGSPASPTPLASREPSALTQAGSKQVQPATALGVAAARPREVTFSGRIEGTFSVAGAPPVISVHLEATGNGTHVGRFELVSDHVVSFITLMGEGGATLTTPNGDSVETDLKGVATPAGPGQFDIEETLEIQEGTGTGRFAGASGSFTVQRSATSPDGVHGTTSGTFSGTIVLRGDRD